jgi:hypothetical protein
MAKSHASNAQSQRRVDDILRIRLDGAEFHDVREFVREKEAEAGSAWFLPDGESPLSDSQIRRYQQKADEVMLASCEQSRKKLRKRHLAQRRNLYARALTTGDIRTALACLDSEAKLLKLFPSERPKPEPPAAAATLVRIVEVVLPGPAQVPRLVDAQDCPAVVEVNGQ